MQVINASGTHLDMQMSKYRRNVFCLKVYSSEVCFDLHGKKKCELKIREISGSFYDVSVNFPTFTQPRFTVF